MSDYDMSIHSSTDAREWTDFFFKTYPNCNVDREAMFGWFANAMMAMHDNKQKPVGWLYEGAVRSSFDGSFTGEWKEEFSRIKPDGTVKGFNPTKLESTIRNLVPLYG
jgi:hypothetical protein